jgi:hypothetical protein
MAERRKLLKQAAERQKVEDVRRSWFFELRRFLNGRRMDARSCSSP